MRDAPISSQKRRGSNTSHGYGVEERSPSVVGGAAGAVVVVVTVSSTMPNVYCVHVCNIGVLLQPYILLRLFVFD